MKYLELQNDSSVISGENEAPKWIYYGLILTLIFEYFDPTVFIPLLKYTRIKSLIPLTVFAGVLFNSSIEKLSARQNKLMIYFILLMVFSMMFAYMKSYALTSFTVILGYMFIYFVFINIVNTMSRLRGILWALSLIHTAIILFNPSTVAAAVTRSKGFNAGFFLVDGNDFSLSIILLLPLTIYLLLSETKFIYKSILGTQIVILFVLLILMQSRATFLAIIALLAFLWISSKKKMLGVILLILLVAGMALFAPSYYFDRVGTIANYEEDNSANHRLHAWKVGFYMALNNPIGVGAGNFNTVYGRFYMEKFVDETLWGARLWISPHSMYVQCLAELGFPGLILLLVIFGSNFKSIHRLKRVLDNKIVTDKTNLFPKFMAASLIAYGVNAFFIGVLYYPHLFILTSIIVVAEHLLIKEENEDSTEEVVTA